MGPLLPQIPEVLPEPVEKIISLASILGMTQVTI
jgi:hypothetical protein